MAITADGQAPYGSPKTVLDVIQFHRDKRYKGPLDDVTLERTQIATSPASMQRARQTLGLLGLIDEDNLPTEALDALATVPEDEFQARFAEVLEEAYRPIFDVVEPSDGYQKVRDAFRGNTPAGQQERMVTLFLNLSVEAGLISEIPAKPSDQKPKSKPDRKSSNTRKAKKSSAPSFDIGGLPPGLLGHIQDIPTGNDSWTTERRDSFLETFAVILNHYVRVDDQPAEVTAPENNGGAS